MPGCGDSTATATVTPTTSTSAVPSTTTTQPTTTAPSKNYNDFLDDLGMRKSSNRYNATNSLGYLGRYQMGAPALKDAGFQNSSGAWTSKANSYGVYSEQDFLNTPAAQDAAITAYHKVVCRYIRHYGSDAYIGATYCGVKVTRSGLLAASHLVGAKAVKNALATGTMAYDGNGVPASEYMALFGGYDVSEVW